MKDQNLTANECEELAAALLEDAGTLSGSERENLVKLAESYRTLASIKRLVLSKVN